MAQVHGVNTQVFFKQFNLTSHFRDFTVERGSDVADSSAFGDSSKEYFAGLRDGTISLGGLFDGAADAVDEEIAAVLAAATAPILSIVPGGTGTIGNRGMSAQAHATSYGVNGSIGDMVSVSAEFQATGGIDNGVVLHGNTAETGTVNGTSVDNGAASTNGYAAYLHVIAANVTTVTIKVQHSTDNAIWADLATFTAVTGLTSERLTGTGTVNRYVRFIISAFTGTSVTPVVLFARR